MGSPITNMLMQPGGNPAMAARLAAQGQRSQAEIDAERDARIKALMQTVQENYAADPSLRPPDIGASMGLPPAQPAPAAAPSAPSGIMGGIMKLLENFSRSAPAKPAPLPTAPPTPEELAARQRVFAGQ